MGRKDVRLGVRLLVRALLALDLPTHNEFPDIILLGEVEEAMDPRRALGTKAWAGRCRLSRDVLLGNARADNGAAHRRAEVLASTARAVAEVAVGKEDADTGRGEDTLLHGKALRIVPALIPRRCPSTRREVHPPAERASRGRYSCQTYVNSERASV